MGFKARPLQVIMSSKLIVAGVLALDDLKTPKRSEKGIVGGAGVYSSVASSFFTNTALIAAIGNNFPNNITATLKEALKMEFQVCQHMIYRNDFNEGVNNILVNKQNNAIYYLHFILRSIYCYVELTYAMLNLQ